MACMVKIQTHSVTAVGRDTIDTMAAAAGGTTASVVSDAESEETVAQGICSDREALDEVRECTRPEKHHRDWTRRRSPSVTGYTRVDQPPRTQPLTSGAMG